MSKQSYPSKQITEFENEYPDYVVIYITEVGSRLYGTDTPNSDIDYKGIFIPSQKDILLKKDIMHYTSDTNNSKQKNSSEDVDFQLWSVYHFFDLLKKMETNAVDVLFSMVNNKGYNTEASNLIVKHHKHLLNNNFKSFLGYAFGQVKKYQIKGKRYNELDHFVKNIYIWSDKHLNNKLSSDWNELKSIVQSQNYEYIKYVFALGPKSNGKQEVIEYISVLGKLFSPDVTYGYLYERLMIQYNQFGNRTKSTSETEEKIDYKGLSHSYRIISEAVELLTTETLVFPSLEAKYIKSIKLGNEDYQEVLENIHNRLDEVDLLLLQNKFSEIDENIFDELLLSFIEEN